MKKWIEEKSQREGERIRDKKKNKSSETIIDISSLSMKSTWYISSSFFLFLSIVSHHNMFCCNASMSLSVPPTLCASPYQAGVNQLECWLNWTNVVAGGWACSVQPYLSTGDVDGHYDVCSVSIEAPYAAGHGWAHQVLADVQIHQSCCTALQDLQHKSICGWSALWFLLDSIYCCSLLPPGQLWRG